MAAFPSGRLMYNLTIGPLTIPTSYVLMLAALLLAVAVAHLSARRQKLGVSGPLTDAALAGLAAGRVVFVLTWWQQYRAAPWSIIDIRDGGVTPWAALTAGLLVAAWRGWRHAPLRRPLALGITVGLLAWQLSGAAMLSGPARPRLPALALSAMNGEPTTLAATAHGKPVVVNLWASWCPPCRQGGHQLAHRLTTTGLPCAVAASVVGSPFIALSASAGNRGRAGPDNMAAPESCHASRPTVIPSASGRRNGAWRQPRHAATSSPAVSAAHGVTPPSRMSMMLHGAARYCCHHVSTKTTRPAANPASAASVSGPLTPSFCRRALRCATATAISSAASINT